MSHSSRTFGSSNLYHQLMQREMNLWPHCNSRSFSAHLFSERYRLARNLYKSDLRAHYGCVNAIEFSHGGKYLASGGDDKRVLIWDVERAIAGQGRPRVLHTEHTSNIFCLGFDRCNRRVFSGGNDDLVILHDFETGKLVNVFKHDNPVYGLSIDPKCDNIFATACEDGQILVFDQRVDSADPLVVAQQRTSFHAVEFHPAGGNFLVTANSKRGAAFWDIRKPHHPVIQYGGHVEDPPSCMSVRFNSNGSLILALRRRLPPILYNTQSPEPVCTFYHGNYYNSCTMKSCTFAGENDEFVLSGSDDFNLYVWRVSDVDLERTDQWVETTQMVLYGHRSIVNQVRYNKQKCLLASSGVEKIVKLWSPFAQKNWTGSLLEEAICSDNPRELYSPYNFTSMSTPPHSWSHMSHDYSSRNTNEDPRMMAFFDSLIQQEIEGWDTNSSTDSSLGSEGTHSCSSSNDSSDSSLDDESDDDDDDGDDGADRTRTRDREREREREHERDSYDNIGETAVQIPNTAVRERTTRNAKRHLIKRKEYKQRKSVFRKKIKLQRLKYVNRIAYLIATKRSRLRRLAIRGASLSNRRPFKIVKVRSSPKNTPSCSKSTTTSKRHASHRISLSHRSNLVDTEPTNVMPIASTSTAAAAGQSSANTTTLGNTNASSHRYQRRKYKKHCVYDTSSDDGRESSAISTIPSNAPSTSTGITTTLKDDIIRLRQQQQHIIDSDEYEDDDEPISSTSVRQQRRSQSVVEVVVDPTVQPTKKLNGVRRANDAAVMERSSRGEPSVNTERLVNGSSEPQRQRFTRHSVISTTSIESAVGENHQALSSDSSSATTAAVPVATTMLPHHSSTIETTLSAASTNNSNGNSSNNNSSYLTNRRRRTHMELTDNYSSHSNSRLSNSSCQDDGVDSSPSSSNEVNVSHGIHNGVDRRTQQYSTPVKRRKLATDGEAESAAMATLKWNNNSNNVSPSSARYEHDYPMTSSSNGFNMTERTVQQPIYASDNSSADATAQVINIAVKQPNRSNAGSHNGNSDCLDTNHEQDTQHQLNGAQNPNHTLLLRTPDSGISIATTITPSLGTCPSSNDSSVSRWSHTNGGLTSVDDTPRNGDGMVTHRLLPLCEESSHTPVALFQQKVARVRRNYRKKFADESDDSD